MDNFTRIFRASLYFVCPGAFGVGHYSRWAIIRRWGIIFSKSIKMGHYLRWAIIRRWSIIRVNTVVGNLIESAIFQLAMVLSSFTRWTDLRGSLLVSQFFLQKFCAWKRPWYIHYARFQNFESFPLLP